jgi:hypothetical protein
MAEQIYPKGMRVFPPRENAPDFVKGKISIHLETFQEWAQNHLDEKGYIAFDLKEGRDGIYASLNTWKKPDQRPQPKDEPGLKEPGTRGDDINPADIPF